MLHGLKDDKNQTDITVWVMSGNQIGSIALPLWVRAGSVPEEIDGDGFSRMCSLSVDISAWITENDRVNTQKLVNNAGTGYWDFAFPIEDEVFTRTAAFLESPGFNYDQLEGFQNAIARNVTDQIDNWESQFYNRTEISHFSNLFRGETYHPGNDDLLDEGKGIIKAPEHRLLSVASVSSNLQLNNFVRNSTHIFDIMGRRISKDSVPYLPDGYYFFVINDHVRKILIVQ
ncbi:hypothetical protein H8D57_01840 [bacterium]|nr:hypothetical protein [bacterium]